MVRRQRQLCRVPSGQYCVHPGARAPSCRPGVPCAARAAQAWLAAAAASGWSCLAERSAGTWSRPAAAALWRIAPRYLRAGLHRLQQALRGRVPPSAPEVSPSPTSSSSLGSQRSADRARGDRAHLCISWCWCWFSIGEMGVWGREFDFFLIMSAIANEHACSSMRSSKRLHARPATHTACV